MLRQPVNDVLYAGTNILLAGCGGGYDILGAIPLLIELTAAGKSVTLASLSFTALDRVAGHEPVDGVPHLFTTSPAAASEEHYCPEAWLAAWLTARSGKAERIWCFESSGVRPLREAYEHVVKATTSTPSF